MPNSFSNLEYAPKSKLTCRDRLLAEIDSMTPWDKSHTLVYPLLSGSKEPVAHQLQWRACYACTWLNSALACRMRH